MPKQLEIPIDLHGNANFSEISKIDRIWRISCRVFQKTTFDVFIITVRVDMLGIIFCINFWHTNFVYFLLMCFVSFVYICCFELLSLLAKVKAN